MAWASSTAVAQDEEPAFASWSKVEATQEMRDYQAKLKKGEFDESARKFLETSILPQLAAEKNMPTIERVRRRLRDVALNERDADAAALDKANDTATRSLTTLARNPKAEPVVRINAMLLVGELRSKDGRPWPGAVPALAAAMADTKLALAVRVAAAAGLGRHAEAGRAGGVDPAFQRETLPKLVAIVAVTPAPEDGAGGEWLVSRALEILPVAAPKASPQAAAALAKIVADAARPIDVRVRAAAALGTTVAADSNVDAGGIVAAIRGLALTALRSDLTASEDLEWSRRLGGQPPPGQPDFAKPTGFPGGLQPTPEPSGPPMQPLVVRRDAWRLIRLADAILAEEGSGGLATLLAGPGKISAEQLATTLRAAGKSLDAAPDAAAVKNALEKIEQTAAAVQAPAAAAPAAATRPTAPAATEKPAESDPFATPGN
ncbi:MAG: hypothetical protein K8S94_08480 [Planctomycetia bacterium]|nr:hypothetical protein [Planctomycetia bacterium]